MKTYEPYEDGKIKMLICLDGDGNKTWIPLDPANSDYAEYLRYEAWVDAGNEPDDFWTQEGGI